MLQQKIWSSRRSRHAVARGPGLLGCSSRADIITFNTFGSFSSFLQCRSRLDVRTC
jgi:hypothetical protein